LFKEALERGVDPSRLIFTPKVEKHEHINRCFLADLALDNALTNGHTTTCDLLWSGLPLVTYPHTENMPSRVASSICCALECPEMVTNSFTMYENTAVHLALNRNELDALRQKIWVKRMTAPLFDTTLWVQNFEKGLREAWRLYSESNCHRAHIDVATLPSTFNSTL